MCMPCFSCWTASVGENDSIFIKCNLLYASPTVTQISMVHHTLINKLLNWYGESPSNGFRWKVCIEWIAFCSKTIHSIWICQRNLIDELSIQHGLSSTIRSMMNLNIHLMIYLLECMSNIWVIPKIIGKCVTKWPKNHISPIHFK